MRPLNIVIVNDFAHVNGGAALVALTSAEALAQRGHHVTLFTAVKPIMPELADSGVEIVCTGQKDILTDSNRLRAAVQGIWNLTAQKLMHQLLENMNRLNTIIHLHGWTKALSSSVIRSARKREFAVVCSLHDYFTACPNGGFFNYKKNQICNLKGMSPSCLVSNCDKIGYSHKLYRLVRQFVQKSLVKMPSDVKNYISISDFSLEILRPYLPPDAGIYAVRNPIFVERAERSRPEESDHFIAVGRLSPEKGLDLLCQAAQKAKVKIVLVGDGEIREQLEAAYPEVTFTGWLDREDTLSRISSARALILPSLWYETQGLVVAEAAALGIPSIVPDRCAASDMVEDGCTGLIFKSGDTRDLADKITEMDQSPLSNKMGKVAFDRFWSDPPTLESHVDHLEDIYRKVLESQI